MKSSGILILALALCIPAAVLLPGACYGGFYASDHFPLYVDFEIK